MHDSWKDILEGAVLLRRRLHRCPELAWNEHRTAAEIRRELTSAGIFWRAAADTGTVAELGRNIPERAVALRAEIDALPISEGNGIPWVSDVSGCMHACGHDGHTATLLAAARWLKSREKTLSQPVVFIFQPGEEGGHGAKAMIQAGALENVGAIYGWHNWPAIPFGRAICPDGIVMAANGTFRITVVGKGGHASQPELCRDPVAGASAIVLALQQIVSRRLPPQSAAVVSITYFNAPGSDTVIPGQAVIGGNIRIAENALRDRLNGLIEEIAQETARAWGVAADVEIFPRYKATLNDPGKARRVRRCLGLELGEGWEDHATAVPVMASEDFYYYLDEVPGALALIGAGGAAPLHNPCYDFNDALIAPAARLLIRLAGGGVPG